MTALEFSELRTVLGPLAANFAELAQKICGGQADSASAALAALLLSRVTGDKHICLNMRETQGRTLGDIVRGQFPSVIGLSIGALIMPDIETVARLPITASPEETENGVLKPLVLDSGGRLYLRRHFDFERELARDIISRAASSPAVADTVKIKEPLDVFTKKRAEKSPGFKLDEHQTAAALSALTGGITVISGGPGTGKTTVAAAIIETARALASGGGLRLNVSVCAPTGKAAARIQEDLDSFLEPSAGGSRPEEAKTIHRLLGYIPDSPFFRHNRENPLPADLLVVDECSMIPLAMMKKLMQAVKPEAKVVLLGDKDQLSSVEPGAVFADICSAESGVLAGHIIELKSSHRFRADSGIGKTAALIRGLDKLAPEEAREKVENVAAAMRDPGADLLFTEFGGSAADFIRMTVRNPEAGPVWAAMAAAGTPEEALRELDKFRLLCPLREGPFGSETVSRGIAAALEREKLIPPPGGLFRRGQPVMITENNYSLRLFNGDTGVVLDSGDGGMTAWFPAAAKDGRAGLVSFPASRLPAFQTVHAMTVHKAQGSGFDTVFILLPPEDSPLLTRELIYTAVTRARRKAVIFGKKELLINALLRKTRRESGLASRLK
jgi:exodeoxyribonuclease V alpha subunit